jgi:hypothetical protein
VPAPSGAPRKAPKAEKKKKQEPLKQWRGIDIRPLHHSFEILDRYQVGSKFSEVVIAAPPGRVVEPIYFVTEAQLSPEEEVALERVKDILTKELDFPKLGEEQEVRKVLHESTLKVLKKYRRATGLGSVTEEQTERFLYYIDRDLLGFGPLNIIMEDFKVEDVSCDGVNVPIYVWHRDFESMPTNIMFNDREALDDFIIHLAHKAGKHVSSAFPIVDAMIYGKHSRTLTSAYQSTIPRTASSKQPRSCKSPVLGSTQPCQVFLQMELNVMMPVMAYNAVYSIQIMTTMMRQLDERCVRGIVANEDKCRWYAETSPSLATALNPYVGYATAAEVVKQALREGRSIIDIVRERNLLTEEQIREVFDPYKMTEPNLGR